ncbi:F-box domain [Fusarium albosuccineum]|uniref:F-box domain n=1 Tax=Fusarium albosuccineum TaxID=1237068 RepID=A0A8H4L231_9HYPO|nr:F-box domain [Fusarium albosuccineum]
MGGWDCYCAICGGPFHVGDGISRKPRTARFRRRLERRLNGDTEQDTSEDDYDPEEEMPTPTSDQQRNDDSSQYEESLATSEEEHSYDPDILSQDGIEWTRTLHVLGFNPAAPSITKAFISGPGRYDMYGTVEVTPGDDPNFSDRSLLTCYCDLNGQDPVFPFHWCCFQLLRQVLTMPPNVHEIDKDLLYSVMLECAEDYCRRLTKLDYGNPGPEEEQYWITEAGKEFLVAHPTKTPAGLSQLIKSTITGSSYDLPHDKSNLTSQVKRDPFTKLPYDLLDRTLSQLPASDLVSLTNASWTVHSALQDEGFWRRRIKHDMVWFSELHPLLDESDFLRGRSRKKIYLWLDKMTYPRVHMSGPFMSIANRRRVWGVCEQLAERYLPRLPKEVGEASSFVEKMIRSQSQCTYMPSVYEPTSTTWDLISTFWVKSWETVDRQERRTVAIANGHSQQREMEGTLLESWQVEGTVRIQRLGLVQAVRPPLDNYSILPEDTTIPRPSLLEAGLWKEDYSGPLGTRIWEHRRLRLITDDSRAFEQMCSNTSRPLEALIWAKDEDELQQVERLTAYTAVGGSIAGVFGGEWQTREYHVIHGMRAHFRSGSTNESRSIGNPEATCDDSSPDNCTVLDIDGPGGEIVTEISFTMQECARALTFETNRGRQAYFGDRDAETRRVLRPDEGETLVGIVISFGGGGAFDEKTKRFERTKMLSVAALATRF